MNSDPVTGTDDAREGRGASPMPAWLCAVLHANDSFYPTGSYAHSFGLEGLVSEGVIRDRDTLRLFLWQSTVPALRHVELPLAAHAWRAFESRNWTTIGELCVLSSALRTSREPRSASENVGRQRAELLAQLRPSTLAQEFVDRAANARWPHAAPISAALEASVLGAPREAALSSVYYSAIMALIAAAMKLLRLGQNAAHSLLAELLAQAPALIAAADTTAIADIGWFNPWLDIASARHETADVRMFMS